MLDQCLKLTVISSYLRGRLDKFPCGSDDKSKGGSGTIDTVFIEITSSPCGRPIYEFRVVPSVSFVELSRKPEICSFKKL